MWQCKVTFCECAIEASRDKNIGPNEYMIQTFKLYYFVEIHSRIKKRRNTDIWSQLALVLNKNLFLKNLQLHEENLINLLFLRYYIDSIWLHKIFVTSVSTWFQELICQAISAVLY